MISRRGFLQTGSAAALLANTASAKQLKTVGVQLYTVRSILPKKPEETLKAIEAIGYKEVEATYDNLDKIWPALQATKLKPVSIHLNESTVMKGTDDEISPRGRQSEAARIFLRRFPLGQPSGPRRAGQNEGASRKAQQNGRKMPRRRTHLLLSQPRVRIRAHGRNHAVPGAGGHPRQEPGQLRDRLLLGKRGRARSSGNPEKSFRPGQTSAPERQSAKAPR